MNAHQRLQVDPNTKVVGAIRVRGNDGDWRSLKKRLFLHNVWQDKITSHWALQIQRSLVCNNKQVVNIACVLTKSKCTELLFCKVSTIRMCISWVTTSEEHNSWQSSCLLCFMAWHVQPDSYYMCCWKPWLEDMQFFKAYVLAVDDNSSWVHGFCKVRVLGLVLPYPVGINAKVCCIFIQVMCPNDGTGMQVPAHHLPAIATETCQCHASHVWCRQAYLIRWTEIRSGHVSCCKDRCIVICSPKLFTPCCQTSLCSLHCARYNFIQSTSVHPFQLVFCVHCGCDGHKMQG